MLSFSRTYQNVLFQTLRLNIKRNLITALLTFISCMLIFSFIARSPENLLANFIGSLLGILAFQLSLLLFTSITTWNQVRETRNKLQEHPDDLPTWHIDDLRLYYTDETILNYIHTKGDAKVANQRNDFLQKQSSILIRENQTICIENLKVSNMVRNHRLAQAISSTSWSRFFTMLTYKASWYGNEIVKIPSNYPSSQICSVCGYQNSLVKNLGIRRWTCPQCHTAHDRNHNASINILRKGLQQLALS